MSPATPGSTRATLGGAGFMVLGAALIQWTAAVVTPTFRLIGPASASAWRFLIGGAILLAFTRPRVRQWTRRQWVGAVALGVTVAFMNLCFYQAIARVPLGTAVAIEYLGPFCVAALAKRTPRHLAFVALAGLGVVALTRPGSGLTVVGGLFAVGAGVGWAAYVFASRRVGTTIEGFSGLAASMAIAALVTVPFAVVHASVLENGHLLVRLAVVALAAIVLGFGAELQGLRRLRPSIAGVILAADPAVAFVIGWAILHQHVRGWDLLGLFCVMVAGAGVMLDSAASVAELAQ